eukprot:1686552-Prymnesium_polylepis.1
MGEERSSVESRLQELSKTLEGEMKGVNGALERLETGSSSISPAMDQAGAARAKSQRHSNGDQAALMQELPLARDLPRAPRGDAAELAGQSSAQPPRFELASQRSSPSTTASRKNKYLLRRSC